MLQIDYNSKITICDQIVNGIIRFKALGVMAPHEQLMSVRALAVKLSINPNTVLKAYQILESRGVIYSQKGKGYFISDDSLADTAIHTKAAEEFKKAVAAALELGLSSEELIKLVKETDSTPEGGKTDDKN